MRTSEFERCSKETVDAQNIQHVLAYSLRTAASDQIHVRWQLCIRRLTKGWMRCIDDRALPDAELSLPRNLLLAST
jgi:hypothetical protein